MPGVPLRPANVDIPNAQFNILAFKNPEPGTWGNAGRNILKVPRLTIGTFRCSKTYRVRERQTVEFRAEMFNLFNTPEFGLPGANLSAPANFGRSTSTLNSTSAGFGRNRQVQFALRYQF